MPLPVEIIGKGRPDITIVWDEGHEGVYDARKLRLACRCAHCIHEFTGEKLLDPAKVPEDIKAIDLSLVGSYGLQITFSDGHATGIYRFADLFERCPCEACKKRRASAKMPVDEDQ